MSKTILITGSTDGIGLELAKMLTKTEHHILIHGRNSEKVNSVVSQLKQMNESIRVEGFVADFSSMKQVKELAKELENKDEKIDVLVNNAGVFVTSDVITKDGLELRFAVNTIAPYFLTKLLAPMMTRDGRVVNLSSAAQAPVDLDALSKAQKMNDGDAYAQSKLALTIWSFAMANDLKSKNKELSIIAVNPKSFLGSKMVKKAYGRQGYDLSIGADILYRAAFSDEFKDASGKYFDNDSERFMSPHPDALNSDKQKEVIKCLEDIILAFN